MPEQPTCEQRLPEHLAGRLADFAALNAAAQDVYSEETLREVLTAHRDALDNLDALPEADPTQDGYSYQDVEAIGETARERIYEYPLGVSSSRVFRVELSTGGPADYLEVFTDGDTPNYEPEGEGEHYSVTRIVYHFADWFDHAQVTLEGHEFDTAERFVSQVVPELVV